MFKKSRQSWQLGLATDKGAVKQVNEDRMMLRLLKDQAGTELLFALVADGMGGYQYGDLASQTIIDFFEQWLDAHEEELFRSIHPFIIFEQAWPEALLALNERLIEYGDFYQKKLGSTLTMIALYKGRYMVAHVGDSRLYHWEKVQPYQVNQTDRLYEAEIGTESLDIEQTLTQLTDDHSWIDQQVKQGKLTRMEAEVHPKRHVLLQCLGIESYLEPYFTQGSYQENDQFILSSDGFHTIYPEKKLINILHEHNNEQVNLQLQVEQLIREVIQLGATDNITLMIIKPLAVIQQLSWRSRILRFLSLD